MYNKFPFHYFIFYTELDKKIYDIIKTRLILVSLSDDHHDEYIETNICSAVMYTDYMYTPTNVSLSANFYLLFCLGFFVLLENFSLIWRRHHDGQGLQMFTYARHLWPLSREGEGSLACQSYCDTGHPLINVISEDPMTLTSIAERLTVELSLPVLTTQVLYNLDLEMSQL